jgi:hypothetical protein
MGIPQIIPISSVIVNIQSLVESHTFLVSFIINRTKIPDAIAIHATG